MYIFASDYDGTLNRGGVSRRDRDAIRAFRQAGNLFGVVTGRDSQFYETACRNGLEIDFILALNGAMTVSATGENAGEIVRADSVCNHGAVRGIAEIVFRRAPWLCCVTHKKRYRFGADAPEGTEEYDPHSLMDTIGEFHSLNTWCEREEDSRLCTEEINRAYGNTVNALQNGTCIDMPPCGIDKGEGLSRFAAEKNVPEEFVYTAGDNLNDMAMIRRFHGCAVENACPEIKQAAEGVYPDVAAMLEMLLAK